MDFDSISDYKILCVIFARAIDQDLDIGHVRLMYPIGYMRQHEAHGAYCSYTNIFMRPQLTRWRLVRAPAARVCPLAAVLK